MSNLTKSSLGLPKHSIQSQICEPGTASTSSISKYFKNKTSSSTSSLESIATSYKNSLSFINTLNCSDDDFKTPTRVKKVPKLLNKKEKIKKNLKTGNKRRSSNRIDSIFKRTKDNFEDLDVNSEHLQMALAMSKSTYEAENPGKRKDDEEDLPVFLCPESIPKVGTTLEKYGFRSKKPKLETEFKIESTDVKRRKFSRFRFVTPILLMRTSEDRDSLIQTKISLVLTQQQYRETKQYLNHNICSEILRKMHVTDSKILKINSLEAEELNSLNFVASTLNISTGESTCGCLLKNWNEIPGRELSPEPVTRKPLEECKSIISQEYKFNAHDTRLDSHIASMETRLDQENAGEVIRTDCLNVPTKSKEITVDQFTTCVVADKNIDLNSSSPKISKNIDTSRCGSPDLFDSDYESFSPKPQSPLKVFQSDKGIEHFESFSQNSRSLSAQFCSSGCSIVSNEQILSDNNIPNQSSARLAPMSPANSDCTVEYNISEIDPNYVYENLERLNNINTETDSPVKTVSDKDSNNSKLASGDNDKVDSFSGIMDDYAIDLTQSSNEPDENEDTNMNKLSQESNIANSLSAESTHSDIELPSFREYLTKSIQKDIAMDLTHESSDSDTESYEASQNSVTSITAFEQKIEATDVMEEPPDTSKGQSNNLNYTNEMAADRWSISSRPRSSYNSSNLNVTEYVNQLLNMQNSSDVFSRKSKSITPNCSEESIVVSDEELNYSSLHSNKGTCYNSDKECIKMDTVEKVNSETKTLASISSEESIIISDEELNYSSLHCSERDRKECDVLDGDDFNEIYFNDSNIFEIDSGETKLENRIRNSDRIEPNSRDLFKEKRKKFYDLSDDEDVSKVYIEDIEKANLELREKYCCQQSQKDEPSTSSPKNVEDDTTETSKPEEIQERDILASGVEINRSSKNHRTKHVKMFSIKKRDVTPEPDYEKLGSPELVKELKKFGIKPLKRNRGIQFLKYIYECTHPVIGSAEAQKFFEIENVKRKEKLVKQDNIVVAANNSVSSENIKPLNDNVLESMNADDFICERKVSTKISSCRLPLQIAWHNFISCKQQLEENILMYEPLQLEVIHNMLKAETGCKFHIEDLITFLDQKCITFRTAQSGHRTRKKC